MSLRAPKKASKRVFLKATVGWVQNVVSQPDVWEQENWKLLKLCFHCIRDPPHPPKNTFVLTSYTQARDLISGKWEENWSSRIKHTPSQKHFWLMVEGMEDMPREICVWKHPPNNFTFDYRREKNWIKPQNDLVHKGSKHSMISNVSFQHEL